MTFGSGGWGRRVGGGDQIFPRFFSANLPVFGISTFLFVLLLPWDQIALFWLAVHSLWSPHQKYYQCFWPAWLLGVKITSHSEIILCSLSINLVSFFFNKMILFWVECSYFHQIQVYEITPVRSCTTQTPFAHSIYWQRLPPKIMTFLWFPFQLWQCCPLW